MMNIMMRTPRMIFATDLVSTESCIVKNQEGWLWTELFETVKYLLPWQTGYQTVRRMKIMTTLWGYTRLSISFPADLPFWVSVQGFTRLFLYIRLWKDVSDYSSISRCSSIHNTTVCIIARHFLYSPLLDVLPDCSCIPHCGILCKTVLEVFTVFQAL